MYIVITNPKNRLLTKQRKKLYIRISIYLSIHLSINYLSNFIVYIIMPKRNDYQGTKYAQILHVDEPIYSIYMERAMLYYILEHMHNDYILVLS